MATVTKRFKEQFDIWAANKIADKSFSVEEMEELKGLLRKEFSPGPDQLRAGQSIINAAGVEVPATIDDHEERYRVWDAFFAAENIAHGYVLKEAA